MTSERSPLERYDGMRSELTRAAVLNELSDTLCQKTESELPIQFPEFTFAMYGIRPDFQETCSESAFPPSRFPECLRLQRYFRTLPRITIVGGYSNLDDEAPALLGLYLRSDRRNSDEGLRLGVQRISPRLWYEGTVSIALETLLDAKDPESLRSDSFPILKIKRVGYKDEGVEAEEAGFVFGARAIAARLKLAPAAVRSQYAQQFKTLLRVMVHRPPNA